jgi:Cu(I)/Ag(I) efflux system membrane fusion protein
MKTFWLGVAICLAACSSGTSKATSPRVADPVPMTERAHATKAPSMLVAYERVRAMLAADSIDGLANAAHEIEASAKTDKIAKAAGALAQATNLDEARLAFAEVSKFVIAVLSSDHELAKGQHLFECPMVKGYNKWVQPTDDLANPYMGKRMLACGGESDWK